VFDNMQSDSDSDDDDDGDDDDVMMLKRWFAEC
jgi:hypothetical protein